MEGENNTIKMLYKNNTDITDHNDIWKKILPFLIEKSVYLVAVNFENFVQFYLYLFLKTSCFAGFLLIIFVAIFLIHLIKTRQNIWY